MSGVLNVRTRLRPTDSPSLIYAAMAERLPTDVMVAFGAGIARELRHELHSWENVAEWAAALAVRLRRPLLLNMPGPGETSRTVVLAPHWSKERLAGWIAGRHAEIE